MYNLWCSKLLQNVHFLLEKSICLQKGVILKAEAEWLSLISLVSLINDKLAIYWF